MALATLSRIKLWCSESFYYGEMSSLTPSAFICAMDLKETESSLHVRILLPSLPSLPSDA